jgi:hypothetical protein
MGTTGSICSEEHKGAEAKGPVIFLSLSNLFDDVQRPPVKFHHQLHAEALKDKGCSACHPANKDGILDYAYPKPCAKENKESLMRAYHDACIGCHKEPVEGTKPGPVTCGECHIWENEKEAKARVVLPDGGFDYYLHDLHMDAAGSDCVSCHHTDDLTSCRDCHGETDSDEASSFRSAAHATCIACHLEYDISASCTDCHVEKKRSAKEMASISRPQTGQPKQTLIACEGATLAGAPFHHEAHEGLATSCRSCHHDTMQGCDSCHTLKGSEKGGSVPLAAAYHEPSSGRSCVGCHNAKKAEALCAGCHHMMPSGLPEASCVVCHSGPQEEGSGERLLEDPASLLPDGVPETLEIGVLAKEYMPAKFPHYAHIRGLTDLSNKDALAQHFHANPLTVCMGCHHMSPLQKKGAVPACITCHAPKAEPTGKVPTLVSAYHRQCLGCHKKMETQPTDCTGCHLEK